MDAKSYDLKVRSWKEFEIEIERILEEHGFEVKSRYIFKDEIGRSEIDIVAERGKITLCIDAKFYSKHRYRASQLKREAKKHFERCERFSKISEKKTIPVIVSYIDDSIYFYEGCIIVPYYSLNYFLTEIYYYLMEFQYLDKK